MEITLVCWNVTFTVGPIGHSVTNTLPPNISSMGGDILEELRIFVDVEANFQMQ